MASYDTLLEKTRVSQPSVQRIAVISVFSKLRSVPEQLGSDSEAGREAISFCLNSASVTVVDQSVRELCRLVSDSILDLSRGLLELQSALEGCAPQLVSLFVKGLGFLIRTGYENKDGNWKLSSTENHPFVRILSSRVETQTELLHQVSLFVMHNRPLGMLGVCEFLEPFLNFVILRIPFADSSPSLFAREVISSMASLCCSLRADALPLFSLLIRCLKYIPGKHLEDNRNFSCIVKTLVDAYTVLLRDLVRTRLEVTEVHLLGLQLVDAILLLFASPHVKTTEQEPVIESLKHLLAAQKDVGLPYSRDLSLVVLSLLYMLAKSIVEHEQLSILKLLLFLLKWKSENEVLPVRDAACSSVEPLLLFPIIALMSSPSRSVKEAASKVLSIVEKVLVTVSNEPKLEVHTNKGGSPLSRVGSVIFRTTQQLWHQNDYASSISYFLRVAYINEKQETYPAIVTWNSLLREHAGRFWDRKKLSASLCLSQEIPILLGAVAGVLVMHPSLGPDAVDSLSAIGSMDPTMTVPLLLAVLYYNNMLSRTDVPCQSLLSKLLRLLPSLAAQQVMLPLIVQTITPMLHKDPKGLLYATAIRLLCQTWVVNDRAFSSLQEVLRPKGFVDFISDRHICISMAASIHDVCKTHHDRGVDLILSVQACIESLDFSVQAFGFQSLSHLCEADVIDFYTAWGVVEKHAQNIKLDPLLAYSVCLLLKWGAMDAEANTEVAKKVVNILWEIGSSMQISHNSQWTEARVSALTALGQYKVSFMESKISDFSKNCAYLLFSETNPKILNALEDLLIKIMIHEHSVRRKYVREKKVPSSKIEKLLDVIPQVIFPAGKEMVTGDLPGAALLCLSFSPRDVKFGSSRSFRDIHGQYEEAFRVVVKSLQLSRNISLALISLQSLKTFMRRWIKANMLLIDATATELSSDKTSKTANNIMKSLLYMAEETLPRSAENIALALGALCAVLPAAAHNVKATASKFLLGRLLEHEHEHRQWTAAISLGLISSSLQVTDHEQKYQNISGLLEVLCSSKSTLVKGACGVGLGFSCQDLLTRTEASVSSDIDSNSHWNQEERLLGRIVSLLSSMLHRLSHTLCDVLESLSALFPPGEDDNVTCLPQLLDENSEDFDDDTWGIAGLIIGLGMSVSAIYRAGKKDAVVKIKNLIVSWILCTDSLKQTPSSNSGVSVRVFSAGSCLALPVVITFCQKAEMFDAHEVDYLINCFKDLISELLTVKKSSALHKSLLMASCIGAGDLLGSFLNEGIHPVDVKSVKGLLELFKTCYSGHWPPLVHFGGMLGIVNALGAGAGNLVDFHPLPRAPPTNSEKHDTSSLSGPLLSNSYFTQQLTPVVQEIFLVAQNTKDRQLQHYAAWAISVLRTYIRSGEASSLRNDIRSDDSHRNSISHNIPEHSMVMKLAQGLTNPSLLLAGRSLNIAIVASALRCLSRAPRLPNLDWGAIIRRFMKQDTQTDVSQSGDVPKQSTLREECFKFSLAHASEFNELLAFLDELSELSRFRALEQCLQSCLLYHLGDLMRIFSSSRMSKLLDDISCFIISLSSDLVYSCDQKSSLRVSCWKGLSQCLEEMSLESSEYIAKIEKCVELLFAVLPVASQSPKADQMGPVKEWSEAVRCLQKSHHDWLYKFLQISSLEPKNGMTEFQSDVKRIQAKAKLARLGSIPYSELGKLKAIILSCGQPDIWDAYIEIVAALHHAEGGVKRQWLIDAVEISCVSSYPSNAIIFVGLLSGICCEYMPFLTLDRSTVLSDMSVTVTSLLCDPNWEVVAETFISFLWTSLERVYSFATDLEGHARQSPQEIEGSERDRAAMLVKVMHYICVAFKYHLPLEKQLRLAAMVIP